MEQCLQAMCHRRRDLKFQLIWEDQVSKMGFVSQYIYYLTFFVIFNIDGPENSGLRTIKQSSEAKNAALSDYHKSLSDRIKDGLQVKEFQNTQRIYLGHDKSDRHKKSYKRAESSKI